MLASTPCSSASREIAGHTGAGMGTSAVAPSVGNFNLPIGTICDVDPCDAARGGALSFVRGVGAPFFVGGDGASESTWRLALMVMSWWMR